MLLIDFLLLFVLHELGHVMACLYYGSYRGMLIKSILHNIIPGWDRTTVAQKSNIHSFGVILGAIPFLWLGNFDAFNFYGINFYALFYLLLCFDDLFYMMGLPILAYFSDLSWNDKVSDLMAWFKGGEYPFWSIDKDLGGMV